MGYREDYVDNAGAGSAGVIFVLFKSLRSSYSYFVVRLAEVLREHQLEALRTRRLNRWEVFNDIYSILVPENNPAIRYPK